VPAAPAPPAPRRRAAVSRAPVYVVAGGLLLAIALVLLGARLAAAPAPPPDLSSPGTPASPRVVNVILRDYAFNPTPLYLVAGETVRFELINGGLVAHEFVLGDTRVQAAWAAANAQATPPAPFATPPPASVPPGTPGLRVLLSPGQRATVEYVVPDVTAGISLMCHLPGHVEQGMVGAVEVSSAERHAPAEDGSDE
jgi:uncharacterized cupredoxin-like copper-binding protein